MEEVPCHCQSTRAVVAISEHNLHIRTFISKNFELSKFRNSWYILEFDKLISTKISRKYEGQVKVRKWVLSELEMIKSYLELSLFFGMLVKWYKYINETFTTKVYGCATMVRAHLVKINLCNLYYTFGSEFCLIIWLLVDNKRLRELEGIRVWPTSYEACVLGTL